MYEKICELMQWRTDLLTAERYEDLTEEFLFPLVIYQQERQLVLDDQESLALVFAKMRSLQKSAGVASVKADVTAIDLPRNGRFRVWLRNINLDSSGGVVSKTELTHYFRETPQGPKTEMVEYGVCGTAGVWEEASELTKRLA